MNVLAPLLTLLLGCISRPAPQESTTLRGSVHTLDGDGIPQARVTVEGAQALTEGDGLFHLDGLPTSPDVLISVEAEGYGVGLLRMPLSLGEEPYVELTLLPRVEATLPDAAEGGSLALGQGLALVLPPGALLDPSGSLASGPVTASVAFSASEDAILAAPYPLADDERGLAASALVELRLWGEAGPLRLGREATLILPLLAPLPEGVERALYLADPATGRWSAHSRGRVEGGALRAPVSSTGWLVAAVDDCGEEQCATLTLLAGSSPGDGVLADATVVAAARTREGGLCVSRHSTDGSGYVQVDLPTKARAQLFLQHLRYRWRTAPFTTKSLPADETLPGGASVGCSRNFGGVSPTLIDLDGDGYGDRGEGSPDCDDGDATIFPGAVETWYDGVDQDCDGEDDFDQDGDGDRSEDYGGTDCADTDATRSGGQPEVCNDQDDDCDGDIDTEDEDVTDAQLYYRDADGDDYGVDDEATNRLSCEDAETMAAESFVLYPGDCNDDKDEIHPGQGEEDCSDGIDENCDGLSETTSADDDDDGYSCSEDCDDDDPSVPSTSDQRCNSKDDDCDGTIDDADELVYTWYRDRDGDGYGDAEGRVLRGTCDPPEGFSAVSGDCDDHPGSRGKSTFPGAAEAESTTACRRDQDQDGHGDDTMTATDLEEGIEAGGDCDDRRDDVSPAADEVCDFGNVDEDCDGAADDDDTGWEEDPSGDTADTGDTGDTSEEPLSPGRALWLHDSDGDGWGTEEEGILGCEAPVGFVLATSIGDCDDTDPTIHPTVTETCDDQDNDCDGFADDEDPEGALDTATWYPDADSDGYGDPSDPASACEAPTGYVADATDCDDRNHAINPGAREICDDLNNDCDRGTDEELRTFTWYLDEDGDGYGLSDSTVSDCGAPTGYTTVGGDCDDTIDSVSPDAVETCNDKDDDCDSGIDEGLDYFTWYKDSDGDGYGSDDETADDCAMPEGYADNADDCEDEDALTRPGAGEVCGDAVVNDCEGLGVNAWSDCGWSTQLTSEIALALGEEAAAELGGAVAAGDLDGDGRADLAAGAVGSSGGAVVIWLSAEGVAVEAEALWTYGASSSGLAGSALAIAGDLNGDGVDDLVTGDPEGHPTIASAGVAWILDISEGEDALSSASVVYGEDSYAELGTAVAGGDLNDDGHADLLLGSPYDSLGGTLAGAVWLAFGSPDGPGEVADAALVGEDASGEAGSAVATCDLNGDGIDDALVGGPEWRSGTNRLGAVWRVSGPVDDDVDLSDAADRVTGESRFDDAGAALACAGDTSGDGLQDALVGAPGYGASESGAAYLLFGAEDWPASLGEAIRFAGESAVDYAGASVAGAGDLDGDGQADLAIGATAFAETETQEGAVYLLFGSSSLESTTLTGDALRARGEGYRALLGSSLAGVSDLRGEGYGAVLAGAPGAADGVGAVFVLEPSW